LPPKACEPVDAPSCSGVVAVAARFAADITITPGYDEMYTETQEDMLIVQVIVQTA